MKATTKNLKDRVANDLRTRVLTLDLAPGSPLDETELCARYELSRTPLREVFHRLAGEGYLKIETNRGASVSSMDVATMRAFFQSAPLVYSAIARLAAEHASAAQIEALKQIQQSFKQSVKANVTTDMAMLNHQFHEHIGGMADSPYLLPSLGRLLIDHTRMSQRFYRNDREEDLERVLEACKQHDAMIVAIENRQAATAVELTLAHWELSRNEMDKYVMPDPLPLDEFSVGMGV